MDEKFDALDEPAARRQEELGAMLLEAARRADAEAALRALDLGADPEARDRETGLTALILAVAARAPTSLECVEALLGRCDPRRAGANGETALMRAAGIGMDRCLAALIPVSDVDAGDASGWGALMHAAYLEEPECVRLLAPRADIGARTAKGQTALDLAIESDCGEAADAIRAEAARREAAALSAVAREPGPGRAPGRPKPL